MFEKYKDRRVYKSLNIVENFSQEFTAYSAEERMSLLDRAFISSSDYRTVLEKLEKVLNQKGIQTFRGRFKKYKYAHKDKTEVIKSKTIRLSPDIHDDLIEVKSKLGCDSHDEVIELLIEMAGL